MSILNKRNRGRAMMIDDRNPRKWNALDTADDVFNRNAIQNTAVTQGNDPHQIKT